MKSYDLIIIGGGITGAGIFREAAASGHSVLLLERHDFCSGTSSRSSKLVHGGLRYLRQGALHLTMDSVRHRERLLRELPGLVTPLSFVMPVYQDTGPSALQMKTGLFLYDLMAGKSRHRFLLPSELSATFPQMNPLWLKGGFLFEDAQVDDAALVLRLIREGCLYPGAEALNYTEVTGLVRRPDGRVTGVRTRDGEIGENNAYGSALVINATGADAALIHPLPSRKQHMRPLRGSHLVFPASLLPLRTAVSFLHPEDHRPVFLLPWEGVLLLGTTDRDAHASDMHTPRIRSEEISYLLTAVQRVFPGIAFHRDSILSTFSGIRPVLSMDRDRSPSDESREHITWQSPGLISVTGGKLTTFRKLARDTLKLACRQKKMKLPDFRTPVVNTRHLPCPPLLNPACWQRLCGRYGEDILKINFRNQSMVQPITGTHHIRAEILLAAADSSVRHLDDLLLRRLRLGILLKNGAMGLIPEIRELASSELGWSDDKWNNEIIRYGAIWQKEHCPNGNLP
ncbi:glycerol-3-phosphate dehydrogenase/oxidase [Desulfobotulus sp. H1]|uniref:Glycerol-3-phosphate dehydrogenase/oxidase n=1 Tax=Desulfobotulus pelophilus TaxID=2823377 RepID=A0ABT3N8B1_9BACT|nr:glycerol-3-phosphate dehydrogenase/oxidase [Desulfobotulus pelophilus]MCW7753698.1 glycerol-3-phosphate dehydrogenase/oxidase [Desulfobotulus pelophilus]